MSELAVTQLPAGTVIELLDLSELPPLEDVIAREIDPRMTLLRRQNWDARDNIQNILRPPRFNGRIADVALTVMDDPGEQVSTVRERGLRFAGNNKPQYDAMKPRNRDEVLRHTIGFMLTANARSSRSGIIGQIQSELYFQPQSSTQKPVSKNRGLSRVRRLVTQPVIEKERFIAADENARRIGLQVLRNAMMHPILQPLRS